MAHRYRLVSFIVEIDEEDWDYDQIREQIGSGEADLYNDDPADWMEENE